MGLLKKIGKFAGRAGAAVATGGASEVYRAATGKADPYTAYQERLGTAVGGKVASAIGQGSDMGPNPYGNETPEERKRRAQQEADVDVARGYRNRLANETAPPRDAPVIGAPAPIRAAHVGTVAPIGAPAPIVAGQVSSTFDPAVQAEAAGLQRAYLERVGAAEAGNTPSAAELQMRAGGTRAVSEAYALAGGHKGYGGGALRNAQRVGAALQQQNINATGQVRANEIAAARQEYGSAVQNMRAGDLAVGQVGSEMNLRAGIANQGAGLSAAQSNQQVTIEVARANQAAKLQENLTQAGFDQQTIMHMSDQQLQTSLANAGFKLTQEQIDDLRQHNLRQAQLEASGQVLTAGNAAAQRETQIKQLRAQYAMAVQQNDQKQQDAILGSLAQLGAAYATGGSSLAAGGATQYGANGSPILD